MSVYYTDTAVTLHHGDCLEVTDWLEADVLCTDPPYGIGGNLSASYKRKRPPGWAPVHERQRWDGTLEVRDAALELWGDKPSLVFGSAARLDGAPPHRQGPLVWDKGDGVGMGDISFPWSPNYELIYVNGAGWAGHRGSSVLRAGHSANAAGRVGHPTPKPIGLMCNLIIKAPRGVIADPFAGSGSTLIAAKQLGRKAIGVELDEAYCEIAARRLSQGVLDFGEVS
jgi:DNA modification methylase